MSARLAEMTIELVRLEGRIFALETDNARLRAALEWYGDRKNWKRDQWREGRPKPVDADEGERARKALGR